LSTIARPSGSDDREIRFYTQQQSHFFLTNYASAPFEIAGQTWPTVEHYFQAMKFPSNPAYQESIREAPTPGRAKRMGAAKEIPIRRDWDVVRDDVMRTALRAKFDANPDMKAGLLSTGACAVPGASSRHGGALMRPGANAAAAHHDPACARYTSLVASRAGSSTLVEDSPTDYYWGCGKERTGRSMLGQLLMQLRAQYRNEAGGADAEGAGSLRPV
jgi:ribA/ribD-fused uncharacterized protein